MEKIVLDTNFLMAIYDLKIDVFEEIFKVCDFKYELYVLEGSIQELERFIKGNLLSKKQAALFAMKILKNKEVKVLESDFKGSVDDQLVDLVDYIMATVDKDLRKRLKEKGVKILTIRQKKYVVAE